MSHEPKQEQGDPGESRDEESGSCLGKETSLVSRESGVEKVWDMERRESGYMIFDIICRRCGYSEEYNPPAGDEVPLNCPQCGLGMQ